MSERERLVELLKQNCHCKGDVARSKNLKNTEVIGNEFDNPEMTEVQK